MSGRVLHASINQMEVGTLQEVDGLWRFQYAAEWLNHPQRLAHMTIYFLFYSLFLLCFP